jgi:hypothetical protein
MFYKFLLGRNLFDKHDRCEQGNYYPLKFNGVSSNYYSFT